MLIKNFVFMLNKRPYLWMYDFSMLLQINEHPSGVVAFDYAKVMKPRSSSPDAWILRVSHFDPDTLQCNYETLRKYTSFLDMNSDYIEMRNSYINQLRPCDRYKYLHP